MPKPKDPQISVRTSVKRSIWRELIARREKTGMSIGLQLRHLIERTWDQPTTTKEAK